MAFLSIVESGSPYFAGIFKPLWTVTRMPTTLYSPIPMRALLAGARRKQDALLDLLRQLVQTESPSDDKAAVDVCVAVVAGRAKMLGGRVRLHRQRAFGDVLEARFGPRAKTRRAKASSAKPILLLGHLDTVWPMGTLKTMSFRVADGRVWGPGTLDMKAGVAMALTAIELLMETGPLRREIVLLLNSDEEVGSPVSRTITERLAAECAAVYVLEPAQGLAYKTARKGTGNWRIEVEGVAAHAGVDFEKGASALRELARVVEKVSGWTDLKRGLTVSVGLAGGGSKTNVIPAQAWAEVDVRIARKADGPRIERKFAALKAVDKRCTLSVSGGINRPPMERTRGTVRLYREARALAAELGFALDEAATGGASDGNFTSALGIPTLDGMGAVGEGAHARHESIVLEHVAARTALLAGLLAQ
ncbi:MAG TPA: M20 family metallopeptidase [Terracidiphilus sp.]|jgi:glutamate carboxypeptidase